MTPTAEGEGEDGGAGMSREEQKEEDDEEHVKNRSKASCRNRVACVPLRCQYDDSLDCKNTVIANICDFTVDRANPIASCIALLRSCSVYTAQRCRPPRVPRTFRSRRSHLSHRRRSGKDARSELVGANWRDRMDSQTKELSSVPLSCKLI